MGSRDQVDPVQLSQCEGVDGISLHLGVRDGLDEFGVSEGQGHALLVEQVPEPVPGRRGFDGGTGGIRELGEVASHGEPRCRQRRLAYDLPGLIDGGDHGGSLV